MDWFLSLCKQGSREEGEDADGGAVTNSEHSQHKVKNFFCKNKLYSVVCLDWELVWQKWTMEKGQGLLLLHQQCHLFHNQHLKTSSNPCSNPCVVTTVNLPVLNQKLVSTAARNLRREHSQGRRVRICRREHCETQRRWDGARDATGPRFVFCLHKAFRDSKRVLKKDRDHFPMAV